MSAVAFLLRVAGVADAAGAARAIETHFILEPHFDPRTIGVCGGSGSPQGLWTNAVRCLPGAAIQFVAYDYIKGLLGVEGGSSD